MGAIDIGNNVFIGSRTIIMPDVKIGNNIIIGAGSVVTKDLVDEGIYGGIPCKKLSDFQDFVNKRKINNIDNRNKEKRYQEVWEKFYQKRK